MREACLEKTEACLESKEPTSLEIDFESEHQEAPKEDAAVKTVRALKKRHGDRLLALERRRKPKKRTQGSGGSCKKLAAARRGMTRRAEVAPRKGRGRDNVARGTSKGRTFGKRRQAQSEGITGISNRVGNKTALQKGRRAEDRKANFHQNSKNECQDIVEGSAPTETKEEATNSLRTMCVGALTTLGSFACTERKRIIMLIHLDRLAPYEGTAQHECL
jgi:hypothetical protein